MVVRTSSTVHMQVTSCGLTAQAVQAAVAFISVSNQGQQLSYWPPAICQFRGITSINLSGNAITFIPQAVQELQGLQQLLISRNDLGSLPPEISALTALTELDVGANRISKLPDALCKLTGLKVCGVRGGPGVELQLVNISLAVQRRNMVGCLQQLLGGCLHSPGSLQYEPTASRLLSLQKRHLWQRSKLPTPC